MPLAQQSRCPVDIVDAVATFVYDPLGFVLWTYPWGQAGTALADEPGPDDWQAELLIDLGDRLRAGAEAGKALAQVVRIAVASGHGIGKSALIAWIVEWWMATRSHPQVVVTANTEKQLTTKTWREVRLWTALSILSNWWTVTATRMEARWSPGTWFAAAIPWNEARPESFAGTHAKHVLLLFDEGSSIPNIIWDNAEGAMTSGECVWVAFGNPTQPTGRFRECFRRHRALWHTRQIDSRRSRIATNQDQIREWISTYGEDSDFVRIRVRGIFPRAGTTQLIPEDVVIAAQRRVPIGYLNDPLIFGVDVARFGNDQSVLYMRQGKATREVHKWRELDNCQVAERVGWFIRQYHPSAVFVDETGMPGTVDTLHHLGFSSVMGVNSANTAIDGETFLNKRIEMWWEMGAWLRSGGTIDANDQELYDDLIGPEYHFARFSQKIQLESKDDMKARHLPSPDTGDALALTFAYPVHPSLGLTRSDPLTRARRVTQTWQAN